MASAKAKCDIPQELIKTGPIDFGLPIMIWDGDCAFCARWIKRWQKITGDKVQYVPYQFFEVDDKRQLKKFPSLSIKDCEKAVQLVMPDGPCYSGAEAVFRTLDASGKKIWLRLYKRLPGFKRLSEVGYHFIASHRPFFSKIAK